MKLCMNVYVYIHIYIYLYYILAVYTKFTLHSFQHLSRF